ncbi:hypothetical protein [Serratia inhibens]|uniref:hypothetical protein n=1 Tax=Serratia inhibens TaxID=2338073 RepID=UPI00025E4CCB|nr:hypothetical protein [Serratia inhibens]ANS43078.1 hypothetical protein Q5A_013125 [Serratia inhibens PRI-2C]
MEDVCFFDNQILAFELPNFEGKKYTFEGVYANRCEKGFKPKSLKVPSAVNAILSKELTKDTYRHYHFESGDHATLPNIDYNLDEYVGYLGISIKHDIVTTIKISHEGDRELMKKLEIIIKFHELGEVRQGFISGVTDDGYVHLLKQSEPITCAIYFRDTKSFEYIAIGSFLLDCSSTIVEVSNFTISKESKIEVNLNILKDLYLDIEGDVPITKIHFDIHNKDDIPKGK